MSKQLFSPGYGILKGFNAKVRVKPDFQPKFCKSRPISFHKREIVAKALTKWEDNGIIEEVLYSDWLIKFNPSEEGLNY